MGVVMVGRNGGVSPVGLGSLEWDGGRGWGWEEATHDGDRILWEGGPLSEGPSCCHGNGCLAVPYPGPSISQSWWGSSGSQVHSLAIPEAYKHSVGY